MADTPLTDVEQKESGATVKFGLNQVSNPTPMFAKYIFRTIAFISGIWAIIPQDLINLSDHTYGQANRWILLGNTIMLFAIKFFGWSNSNDNA